MFCVLVRYYLCNDSTQTMDAGAKCAEKQFPYFSLGPEALICALVIITLPILCSRKNGVGTITDFTSQNVNK